MSRVVALSIEDLDDALVVLSTKRRLYAASSRDGTYFHLIRPARATDPRVIESRAKVGDLMCDCIGSTTHGRCYQQMNAEAWEKADAAELRRPDFLGGDARTALDAGTATFDAPAGAGDLQEAYRG